MTFFLLEVFSFLRPIMFINVGMTFGGLNIFEIFAIVFVSVLLLIFLISLAQKTRITLTAIDCLIIAYSFWCVFVYALYFEEAHITDLAKLLIPLFTYIVAKDIIGDQRRYLRLIFVMIVGFTVPALWSAKLILHGEGLDAINYWTGIPRYLGVYANPHNLGHNMTFVIILMVAYVTIIKLTRARTGGIKTWQWLFMALLGAVALFCLYKSYVRTAYMGLLIFMAVYAFFYNRKWLIIGSLAGVIVAMHFAALLSKIFIDVVEVEEGVKSAEYLGSGRPLIWLHNLSEFSEMTIDRQLAGVGIGNRVPVLKYRPGTDNIWNSHNDYLEVMIETGIVGFCLYAALQLLFLRAILRIPGQERYLFIAIFVAVFLMNFASNSIGTRFGLAQMYYLLMAYVELPRAREAQREVPVRVRTIASGYSS